MDKELALILSEMLIKQDENTSRIQETNNILEKFIGVTTEFIGTTREFIGTTREFMGTSTEFMGRSTEFMGTTTEFMGISVKQWEEQQRFNEVLIGEIREIKDAVKTFAQIESRIKAVEDREDRFEARLANVERMLRAS